MCETFSFVTDPVNHGGKRFYFHWYSRKTLDGGHDSHSRICHFYGLDEDMCNKYEYNIFDRSVKVDQINSEIDDRVQVKNWLETFDIRKIFPKATGHQLNIVPRQFLPSYHSELVRKVEDTLRRMHADHAFMGLIRELSHDTYYSLLNSVREHKAISDRYWVDSSIAAMYLCKYFGYKEDVYDYEPVIELLNDGILPIIGWGGDNLLFSSSVYEVLGRCICPIGE